MNWINTEDELPPENKMVLIRTRLQPIVQFAIAHWSEDQDCFVDYNDYAYTASHWAALSDPALMDRLIATKEKKEESKRRVQSGENPSDVAKDLGLELINPL